MKRALLALVAFVGFAGAAWSADVEVRYTPGALSFSGGTSFTNAVLEIRGPNDFEAVNRKPGIAGFPGAGRKDTRRVLSVFAQRGDGRKGEAEKAGR